MKKNNTLEQDMSLRFVHHIYGLINEFTIKRYTYYHDSYIEGNCVVHMHKFKRQGVVRQTKLKELCKHLELNGIHGFKPTSKKTESHSGIVLYHKVRL